MNKGDLIAAVAEHADLTKVQAGEAVDAVLEAITATLKKGYEVRLVGFGTFAISHRKAGEARNPRTGEIIKTKASKAPKFKAGAALKAAVN
jgi:DNA-binding protein HU-beta